MLDTVVTAKGQIVIPSKIRRRLNIKKGTRLSIVERGNEIILRPLTEDYFESMAGVLNTKGSPSKDADTGDKG
jgi:AbrB family looped-hinge helix DNA binding protein